MQNDVLVQKVARYLLLSRLLTRSGDQAWDFAVPIALLQLLPGQLRVAAFYYLIVRIGLVFLTPRITLLIDTKDRIFSIRLGILLQLTGVAIVAGAIFAFSKALSSFGETVNVSSVVSFSVLSFGGILSGLGAAYSEILVANDIVPSAFTPSALPQFNSRIRQVDLFTEVTSPVVAGLLLTLATPAVPLLGFFVIVFWNLFSFAPEYFLLMQVLNFRIDLKSKIPRIASERLETFTTKLVSGWQDFFKSPIALSMLAYSVLWLSVLSPHGVLLTGYLKDGLNVPEWQIGTFRGLGAFFGLLATVLFPIAVRKLGIIRASRLFLCLQAVCVIVVVAGLQIGGSEGRYVFLGFILLSRIGLYGFSLGEVQIRQVGIEPENRGRINGFASSLTAIATLLLFLGGTLLPSTQQFPILVWLSAVAVVISILVFIYWSEARNLNT